MDPQDLCKQLKQDRDNLMETHRKNTRLYVIAVSALGLFSLVSFGNNMVLHSTVTQQGMQIEVIRRNYVDYDNFIMFNRTYELQLEHTQALLNGDQAQLKEVQNRYNELRSLIVRQPITRSGP